MIKAIFFDFDMTLVDTGKIGRAVYNAFSEHTETKPTEKGFDDFMGTRISENITKFAKNKEDSEFLRKLYLEIHKMNISRIKIYGKQILDYLKKSHIKVIIISNTSRKVLDLVCRKFKLYTTKIIGDENLRLREEKHQAIKKTMKELGLNKNEVFYVGDHINDIKEGKKAGVRVVSVTTGVFSEKQLEKHHPYRVISNLNQLINII